MVVPGSNPGLGVKNMKGLIGRLVVIFCIMLSASGIFLLVNRPTGVGVSCSGEINGFGSPSYPLTSYETECRAEVEVSHDGTTVCTGSGTVRPGSGIVGCPGIDDFEGENLDVSARFYDDSGNYANASGNFYNSR